MQSGVNNGADYYCRLCNLNFVTRGSLMRHFNSSTHTRKSGESSQQLELCDYPPCTRTFARKDIKERHMKEVHEGEKRSISTTAAWDYRISGLPSTNEEELYNGCGNLSCRKSFPKEVHRQNHLRRVHENRFAERHRSIQILGLSQTQQIDSDLNNHERAAEPIILAELLCDSMNSHNVDTLRDFEKHIHPAYTTRLEYENKGGICESFMGPRTLDWRFFHNMHCAGIENVSQYFIETTSDLCDVDETGNRAKLLTRNVTTGTNGNKVYAVHLCDWIFEDNKWLWRTVEAGVPYF